MYDPLNLMNDNNDDNPRLLFPLIMSIFTLIWVIILAIAIIMKLG
jgi:hypothetical protein